MGCIVSKKAAPVTPALESTWEVQASREFSEAFRNRIKVDSESGEFEKVTSNGGRSSRSFRLGNFSKHLEGEQVAAGWPAWLSAVAGEAIQGWVPLKADSFEKLEKIGQGTYSTVFKAHNLDTGRIVALKKVRLDNFDPENVRFVAREIQILRRLDHPNVVKLEGLITSQLSCSMYLVLEYVEHDLAGLISASNVQFSESQVKCYVKQLLSGLEHCHSRGVMHRDIKCANLLVSSEGIMKVADFGLANFLNPEYKQPLTSRVVTLWYRPPELLLGSIYYEPTVDLWSVGCVFGELLLGKPILQGRTEVEQLHKIFKLCGSPPDEFWNKSKLPHATLFKPQHPYGNCLREMFRGLSASAFNLLATFLSVESYKRGTASTALVSEYFRVKPYACEPSSLPQCPPTKEIDAKRQDPHRIRIGNRRHELEATRRPSVPSRSSQEVNNLSEFASHHEGSRMNARGIYDEKLKLDHFRVKCDSRLTADKQPPISKANPIHDGKHIKEIIQDEQSISRPLHMSSSSGFSWVKKHRETHPCIMSNDISGSRDPASIGLRPRNILQAKYISDLIEEDCDDPTESDSGENPHELSRQEMLRRWAESVHRESFNAADLYCSRILSKDNILRDAVSFKLNILDYQDESAKVEFSNPLLSRSCKFDEFPERHEEHIGRVAPRSRHQRGKN